MIRCAWCKVEIADENWSQPWRKEKQFRCKSCNKIYNARNNPKHNALKMYVNG